MTSSRSTCRVCAPCRPDGEQRGLGVFGAAVLDRAQPSGEARSTMCGCAWPSATRSIAASSSPAVVRRGQGGDQPIASGTRFFDPSVKLPAYDPRLAATLLNGAGLLAGADGVRFSLRHLVAPYGEVWTRLSAYLRASLARVGIDLRLEDHRPAAWRRRIAARGLRHVCLLRLSVWRSDLGRGAQLRVGQHPQRGVCQHRRLCEPAGGCLVSRGPAWRPTRTSARPRSARCRRFSPPTFRRSG